MFIIFLKWRFILFTIFVLLCTGCGGAKSTVAPEFNTASPRILALLPIKAPEGVRKERIEYIADCFRSELKNRGYLLLEDEVVSAHCKDLQCPERIVLGEKYGVDGFASVDISTLSRNNFLAGFVDILKGNLQLTDRKGTELITVSHTEQESGGLLLQSGQVLQGIKAQARNFGDDGFNLLAEKFTKAIALKIPEYQSGGNTSSTPVEIASVNLKPVKPSVYEVCAKGTPDMLASVVIAGGIPAPLRATTNNQYCGIYRLSGTTVSDDPRSFVEFRTAYGDITRRVLDVKLERYCDLSNSITLAHPGNKAELKVDPPCEHGRVLVYRSKAELGPYVKIGELMGPLWSNAISGPEEKYQVLAISPGGVPSLPIVPQTRS